MEGIQSSGGMQHLSQVFMQSRPPEGSSPPMMGDMPLPASAQITNEQGQSLFDIRDKISAAVSEALENNDGSQDVRSVIDEAISSTLEENGFDPDEVKAAMDAEIGSMPRPPGLGGGSPFGESPSESTDPTALLSGGEASDDIVASFLQQFRSGTNLDVLS